MLEAMDKVFYLPSVAEREWSAVLEVLHGYLPVQELSAGARAEFDVAMRGHWDARPFEFQVITHVADPAHEQAVREALDGQADAFRAAIEKRDLRFLMRFARLEAELARLRHTPKPV